MLLDEESYLKSVPIRRIGPHAPSRESVAVLEHFFIDLPSTLQIQENTIHVAFQVFTRCVMDIAIEKKDYPLYCLVAGQLGIKCHEKDDFIPPTDIQ